MTELDIQAELARIDKMRVASNTARDVSTTPAWHALVALNIIAVVSMGVGMALLAAGILIANGCV